MSIEIKNIIDNYDNYCLAECEDGCFCLIEKGDPYCDHFCIDYIHKLMNETELGADELIDKIQKINKLDIIYKIGYKRVSDDKIQIYIIFPDGKIMEW